jgi:hypothetical protein
MIEEQDASYIKNEIDIMQNVSHVTISTLFFQSPDRL